MKEKELREGLNRLLSERENPTAGERGLNRLFGEPMTPDESRSVSDRLWALRERVRELREEAENLSSLLDQHFGSRLSLVDDLLTQIDDLTDETMSLMTKGAPADE